MHSLNLNVSNEAYNHLIYFISNIKNDIEIIKDEVIEPLDIEIVDKNEDDYKLYQEAKTRREKGEKTYSLDEMMKEFQ